MSLVTSDDVYNSETRYVEQKAIIYFSSSNVLSITRDNYLVTSSMLEEAHSQSGSVPFGGVTSNELSLELLNENGIFSPTNKTSPYYGLMKKGVKIELFIRPVVETEDEEQQYEWDPLGVYYVTDWQAKATGLIATVIANDQLYKAFNKDLKTLSICRDMTQKEFYQYIFNNLNIKGDIDDTLNAVLKYAYINQETKELLSTLNLSALADCFCKHDGTIKVQDLVNVGEIRATITDANQIISANIEQSLVYNYDGVNITYNLPQESDPVNVLSLKDVVVPEGISERNNVSLTGTPLLRLCYSILKGAKARITNLTATTFTIDITIENEGEEATDCLIDIYGTTLVNNEMTIGLETENPLAINNQDIQGENYAQMIYSRLKAYITNQLPILELEVRGNPKFELGDIIQADSDKYELHYTGILVKQVFDYDGSLKSTITLLNTSILKGV